MMASVSGAGHPQRVGHRDAGEILQRKRVLGRAEAVDHLAVAHPERHPSDLHGGALDVEALQVAQRVEAGDQVRHRQAALTCQ